MSFSSDLVCRAVLCSSIISAEPFPVVFILCSPLRRPKIVLCCVMKEAAQNLHLHQCFTMLKKLETTYNIAFRSYHTLTSRR